LANQIEPEQMDSGEIEPGQTESGEKSGQTRRSFLAKMGLGAAALAVVGGPLGFLGRFRGSREEIASQGFPDEDSIFHPASDPRQDSRRKS
jgi:hypothetical protein